MVRTMYSTCGLEVLRSMRTTSVSADFCSLPAITICSTPTHAPRLPSQYSGSGIHALQYVEGLGCEQEGAHLVALVRDELHEVERV